MSSISSRNSKLAEVKATPDRSDHRKVVDDPIPSNVLSIVHEYALQAPTSVSLAMLTKTGLTGGGSGGDFWGRTYHSASNKRGIQWGRLGQRMASERILIQMANFLRQELPVRLSHRIQDLDQCPHMRDTRAVRAVKRIYVDSFITLIESPRQIHSLPEEQTFADLLAALYDNHAGVLVQMAQGAYEVRERVRHEQKLQRRRQFRLPPHHSSDSISIAATVATTTTNENTTALGDDQMRFTPGDDAFVNYPPLLENTTAAVAADEDGFEQMAACHQFLDRFYISRIGIRFLAGQYLSLRATTRAANARATATTLFQSNNNNQTDNPKTQAYQNQTTGNQHHEPQYYVGMICQRTSPYHCVQQAVNDASMMCRRSYGRCPRVEITGRLDLTFPYIPTYLHYILLELLKNALRATMEQHRTSAVVPPVRVIISDGTTNEDIVIKIADEGGGIPRSQMDKIWSYLFTTADPDVQEQFITDQHSTSPDHSKESPLAGLGYGLPISRSYCRYFGGDLDLLSMEGFGTDAFVYLKRLGDAKEPVPV